MLTLSTFLMTAIFVPDEACSNDRLNWKLLGEPGSAMCYNNQKRCALGEVVCMEEEERSTKRQYILPPGIELLKSNPITLFSQSANFSRFFFFEIHMTIQLKSNPLKQNTFKNEFASVTQNQVLKLSES